MKKAGTYGWQPVKGTLCPNPLPIIRRFLEAGFTLKIELP